MTATKRKNDDGMVEYKVKENISDSSDPGDQYTWATEIGLQTKP